MNNGSARAEAAALRYGWLAVATVAVLTGWALMPLYTAPPAAAAGAPRAIVTSEPTEEAGDPTDEQRIGQSVAGEPLVVHRFGTGEQKRLIVAGIHGGYEWNTIELAEMLIGFLQERPTLVPDDVTLYILPALNPDGAARSRGYEGRANENGVDLNRNFPHNWKADWNTTGCWDFLPIGAGDHPWSEPETQALSRFILSEHIEAVISYHSAALGIFAGGRPPHQASTDLAEEIAAVTDYPYPPVNTGCDYSGNLADWAAANGTAAVDIELSTHYSTDYTTNLRVLLTFLYWRP